MKKRGEQLLLIAMLAVAWAATACGDEPEPRGPKAQGGSGGGETAGGMAGLAGGGGAAAQGGEEAEGGSAAGGATSGGGAGAGGDRADAGAGPAGAAGHAGGAGAGGGDSGGPCTPTNALVFANQSYAADARVRPNEALFSYIDTLDDPNTQLLRLQNVGTTTAVITDVSISNNDLLVQAPASVSPSIGDSVPAATTAAVFPKAFRQYQLASAFIAIPSVTLPFTLQPGESLAVMVQFLSTQTNPPDRAENIGGHAVTAALIAVSDMGCAKAGLYGIGLWNDSEVASDPQTELPSNNWARHEPTFGQILATLGYRVNVGPALIALVNTNDSSAPLQSNPTSEEVTAPRFVRANGKEPVGLWVVGRFSPPLDMPYGWYQAGDLNPSNAQPPAVAPFEQPPFPKPLRVVGKMSSTFASDWDTSNKSVMILPPLTQDSATSFEPGNAPFGLWAFSYQRSTGGVSSTYMASPNPAFGDFIYTEDVLNIPATHQHRARVYPLKDRGGVNVPHSYLIGWEEAANGDYQDYVFVLTNAEPAALQGRD